MSTLGIAELDPIECAEPDCDHTAHHGHRMYLHQNCHTSKGIRAVKVGSKVELRCVVCGKYVVSIELKGNGVVPAKHECGSPFWVSYMNGILYFECMGHEEQLGIMEVAEHGRN